MRKIPMGPEKLLYPMPVVLVGTNVDDEPNFMTVAWCSMVESEPPMISIAIHRHRHTHKGMRQNLTFSVNVPSSDMVVETDYCGIRTGRKVNKVEVCQFKVFYGKLNSAPLIEQCPINLECEVVHILNLGNHSLIVGRIEEIYVSENCLTDGKPDINKIKPFSCIDPYYRQYRLLGEVLAPGWSIGEKLKSREKV